MSNKNPTVRERLAAVETELKALSKYVVNDLNHRVTRIELAVYTLVLGVAALLAEMLRGS